MKVKFRRTAFAALTLTMAATLTASQILAFANTGKKNIISSESTGNVLATNVTGQVNTDSIMNANLAKNVFETGEDEEKGEYGQYSTETVIISLKTPSIADRINGEGSVTEYLGSAAGAKALQEIYSSQNALFALLTSNGIMFEQVDRYTNAINAVAIEVNTANLKKINSLSGVAMTGVSKTYARLESASGGSGDSAQTNPNNVYATGIYNSSEYVEQGIDGSGVTVAILDTGIDYTHEAFQKQPETLGLTSAELDGIIASGNLHAVERAKSMGLNATSKELYVSDKIPFAFDYADNDADVYPSYSQHGVHVAGIVAGQADTYVDKDGYLQGTPGDGKMDFMGVAPEAQLVICKVFTDDLDDEDLGGATSEDIIAALDDCYTLGVDIVNMSLGTTSGFSSVEIDGDSEGAQLNAVYRKLKTAGISLISAAGNEYSSGFGSDFGTNLASNPDSGTVGSPSTFDGAISVASINGQTSPYLLANGKDPIYYNEANDANAVPYDFAELMLGGEESGTFKYVVISGQGNAGDYTASIKRQLADKSEGKVIAVVRRGVTTFQEKVEEAKEAGADGVIIYNNVAGSVRMTLGDIIDPIPAISITMDAGRYLTYDSSTGRSRSSGTVEINKTYQAGPFMNDYSSWGATPDMKLKPDVTSHGGEITSAVAGGYAEMSGTSMATPNLAGLMALVKDYLRDKTGLEGAELTTRTNQIVMSTATLVYDEEKLLYSPRKQGSGLATLDNIFTTNAYLYTEEKNGGAEDDRPKAELGIDKDKRGVYSFSFKVHNFNSDTSAAALQFSIKSNFMTETLSTDRLAVAEAAYMLDDNPAVIKVDGAAYTGGNISVASGEEKTISVELTLSAAEKRYIDQSFANGMYVEGFIQLVSATDGQSDLNLPFMGFYGDWEAAPMLDYDVYEMAEIEKDNSKPDWEKAKPSVFATQLYSTYYNGKYAVPMGSFAYLQDEDADQVYTEEDHCSVSMYNDFHGATANDNYLTSTGLRALYAGLLRNAEVIKYEIYDCNTGELAYSGEKFRVGKAIAGGGSATPALVELKLDPITMGLKANGKYEMTFHFYRTEADVDNPDKQDNTFSTVFYLDYDAPLLTESRVRYYDYEEGNRTKQRVYLDLDIYDNHYPQDVLLCYSDTQPEIDDMGRITNNIELNMATKFVIPIYNPVKNGTNTVSVEITDIINEYLGGEELVNLKDRLYIQIDDYALNHSVYSLAFDRSNVANQQAFSLVTDGKLTKSRGTGNEYELDLGVNEAYKFNLDCGTSNISNYTWTSSRTDLLKVNNGEVFGVAAGDTYLSVTSQGYGSARIHVKISDKGIAAPTRTAISFGMIENSNLSLQKASGSMDVNAGQTFDMNLIPDLWYFPLETLRIRWRSNNSEIAGLVVPEGSQLIKNGSAEYCDTDGVTSLKVVTHNERGLAMISATVLSGSNTETAYSATVMFNVQEPARVENMTLSAYYGSEKEVILPDDKNIMYIGEEAFKDNDTMEVLVIPRTVTQISERAFRNCTALKEVYFIKKTEEGDQPEVDLADLNLILRDAFMGCTALEKIDLTNIKVTTVGESAFENCKKLEKIVHMEKIGTMDDRAFAGCEKLASVDISGLHTSGINVFEGCTGIEQITTARFTAIGEGAFKGCTKIQNLTINNPIISAGAFENCTTLSSVTFGGDGAVAGTAFTVGESAFKGCIALESVTFGSGFTAYSIGDGAFENCGRLSAFTIPNGDVKLGHNVFGSNTTVTWTGLQSDDSGVYSGTTLVKAPATITAGFNIKADTEYIGDYAFADSTFEVETITLPVNLKGIGEGAFYGAGISSISIPVGVTVIPASAFRASGLTAIEIPSAITSVGAYAFADCASLASVNFAGSSECASIGDYAFRGCTSLNTVTLYDGISSMGNGVFAGCTTLSEATLPSLTSLGYGTFAGDNALTTVTFGDGATTVGTYTFFDLTRLSSVTIGSATEEIGAYAFAMSTDRTPSALTSIDLKNVTKVGEGAFMNNTSLATVTGGLGKLTDIGNYAFTSTGITSAELTAAVNIGVSAFENAPLTTLTIPSAENISGYAFASTNIESVTIPASLKTFGGGALANCRNLNAVTAESGDFFAQNNVLYRTISDGVFELCAYPAGLKNSSYTVIEGTAAIGGYAFFNDSSLRRVTLPYSVTTIGVRAFYGSNITDYYFESIAAPSLLVVTLEPPADATAFRSLNYENFNEGIRTFEPQLYTTAPSPSTLKLHFPTNGTGYDNYIYSLYFGDRQASGVMPTLVTRALIKDIDGLDENDVSALSDKAQVQAYSDKVKSIHASYNSIANDSAQLAFLNDGTDRAQKLFDIEAALKPVKSQYGITVKATALAIAPDSEHRTEYKVGERFDMTGLKLIVTYDDYSTEYADISRIKLSSRHDKPLDSTYYNYVTLEGYGVSVMVPITVTEVNGGGASGGTGESGGGSSKVGVIAAVAAASCAAAAAAAAAVVITRRKNKAKSAATGEGEITEENSDKDGEQSEED